MQSLFQASPPGGGGSQPVWSLPKKVVALCVFQRTVQSFLHRQSSRYQKCAFGEKSRRAKIRDDTLRPRARVMNRVSCARSRLLPLGRQYRSSMVSLPGGLALREAHPPRNLLTKTKKLTEDEPNYGSNGQNIDFIDRLLGSLTAFSGLK